ncbi:hypothetical protein, partial [Cronobacter sakazakii]|uniref:hypothetical protein n=1 Tax=Cronobacter sakazakii TaxID=28141 RepID=UPI001EFE917B
MGLAGKKIVLGVSGGIAAYKTPELVRRLRARGAAEERAAGGERETRGFAYRALVGAASGAGARQRRLAGVLTPSRRGGENMVRSGMSFEDLWPLLAQGTLETLYMV